MKKIIFLSILIICLSLSAVCAEDIESESYNSLFFEESYTDISVENNYGDLYDSNDYKTKIDLVEVNGEYYLKKNVDGNNNIIGKDVVEVNQSTYENNNLMIGNFNRNMQIDNVLFNDINFNNDNSRIYFTILKSDVQRGTQFQVILKYYTAGSVDGTPIPNVIVNFKVNNASYNRTTDSNGIASLNIISLPLGYHIITFSYGGFSNDMNMLVYEGNTHLVYRINEVYKKEKFDVVLLDANNNPISNKTVKFEVNGANPYYKTTDANGIASLTINLEAGTYPIYYSFEGSGSYSSCSYSTLLTVKRKNVVLTPLSASITTNRESFKVKLTDYNYKPIQGETVIIRVHNVNYNKITGSDGIASLSIHLTGGYFYTFTVTFTPSSNSQYNSYFISTSVPIIDTSAETKVEFSGSYFRKNSYLTATLSHLYGGGISGRDLDLWINNQSVTATTNAQGQASFLLNFNPGVYGISIMYADVGHRSSYVYRVICISDGTMDNDYSSSWQDYSTDYQCLNNQFITDLANTLTLNCNSDLEKAIAIHDYVLRMNYRFYGDGFNNAYKSAILCEGNCIDKSNVFMALAKKAGLTVRGVTGISSDLSIGHAWTQVKIDNKWVVVELTSYDFACWSGSERFSNNRMYFAAFYKDCYSGYV